MYTCQQTVKDEPLEGKHNSQDTKMYTCQQTVKDEPLEAKHKAQLSRHNNVHISTNCQR